ncbi:MAG: aspartyl/asparaginyl beta-hydroxylase domain-containing protein [Rubrivivax sp.]|nr:aspartyl/asparaginyl beta-hydroxylase domain-containing protein [Rubrivivax sp.]
MASKQPAWAQDPRLGRAQWHAQRGEVLQADVLLRGLLKDHPDCLPALDGLSSFAAERGDLQMAAGLIGQALRLAPEDPGLALRQAQILAADGQLDEAALRLQALLQAHPDEGLAWLLLADVREVQGNTLGALRARYQGITRSQKAGRWLDRASTEPQLLETVLRHIESLRQQRREQFRASFDSVRTAFGASELQRVDRALSGFLGEWDATPPDPRQRPKFFYFPDLPPGPYHDPYLQPWARTLQQAWEPIRDEALGLLQEDRDFESFLGLKPGQKAPDYVGGSNPNASWDAFFFYRRGRRFDANHLRCPVTSAVLESVELCRVGQQAPEVCFSVIRPQSTIVRHFGVTNTRLVMHLPLLVPPGCALNVIDGGEHAWKPGELMMFDDTFQHEAWNTSDEPRLIVLMDCWNPHLTEPEKLAVKALVEMIDSVENSAAVA